MADYVHMPRLGQSMEEGTILQWFKREGDSVRAGEALLEVMSDKANFEVEATATGVLRKILVDPDGTVSVNSPIAIIGGIDESIDKLLDLAQGSQLSPEDASPSLSSDVTDVQAHTASPLSESAGRTPISPRAQRLADERNVQISRLAGIGSGPGGRVIERDVLNFLERQAALAPVAEDSRPRATPLAARMADDLGIDLSDLSLGLPGSRVRAEDVRRVVQSTHLSSPAGGPAIAQRIPFRGMRKLIADNVARSRQTAPHVTLTLEADMTQAAALVAKMQPEIQSSHGVKLTVTDLLVKAGSRALNAHPFCNAALVGEEIILYADRNIGVAVATEAGLIVPVVRNADEKSLGEISAELKSLIQRCREGKQTKEDLAGGTFTITNLGAFGIDVFDPVIVSPQSCILGVGRIADKPVVIDRSVVVRAMMNLCLSFDHRVLDGVPAARFLQRMKELLESPALIFV